MNLRLTALIAGLLVFSVLMIGCTCNIKVTRPTLDGQNLPSYYLLKAEVAGRCTDCTIDEFNAQLDGQDVTSYFTCSYGECSGYLPSFQLGSHLLEVNADLSSNSYMCRVGNESDKRQFYVGAPDDKEALSRPTVESPLYECATALTVSGFVPGATIEILANGTASIGGGVSDSPSGARFSINPPLTVGQKITAKQTYDGITSPPSDEVTVESYFASHPEGLPKPMLQTPVHDCGGAIAVRNLVSGGLLEVFADNTLVGSVNGCGSGQWLFVNPPFVKEQKVHATETLCEKKSPDSDTAEVIEAPQSLPPPTVGDVYEGGTRVNVYNIINGAMVDVYNGTQRVAGHYCSGGGQVFRLNPAPAVGDTLTAVQSLCDVKSAPSDPVTVKSCNELPAPQLSPICAGEDFVIVSGAQPDARILVFADGSLVADGGGHRINLFHPVTGGEVLIAFQQLGTCVSLPSAPVTVGTGLVKQGSLLTMKNGHPFFAPESNEAQIDPLVYTRGTGCPPYFVVKVTSAEQVMVDIEDSLGRHIKTIQLHQTGGYWEGLWDWTSSQWSTIPDDIPVGEYRATLTVTGGGETQREEMPFYVIFSPSEVSAPAEFAFSQKGEIGIWYYSPASGKTRAIVYYLHPDDNRVFSEAIKLANGHTSAYEASQAIMEWVAPQNSSYCSTGNLPSTITKRFVYSICTSETDVLDLLARPDKLAQCADSANIFVAMLRGIGIPSHPSTGDAASEHGAIGWGFDTWSEARLNGPSGEQWYVFHPHDPPHGYGPVSQTSFGTNHPWATKRVNDTVIMAKPNWVSSQVTDGNDDVHMTYGTPCKEPDQHFSFIQSWIQHMCLSQYYGPGYWGAGHWTCSPPREQPITIGFEKKTYRAGDKVRFTITVDNITEEKIRETIVISIGQDNTLTKVTPDVVLKKYIESLDLASGESKRFTYEFTLPLTIASDNTYSVIVDVPKKKEFYTIKEFQVLPLFSWSIDLPEVLPVNETGTVSLKVMNTSNTKIEDLKAVLKVPRHLSAEMRSKTPVQLKPGNEFVFKWKIKALSRSAASQLVFSVDSANGGSVKIYKGLQIK